MWHNHWLLGKNVHPPHWLAVVHGHCWLSLKERLQRRWWLLWLLQLLVVFSCLSSKHLLTTSWATVQLEKEWRRVKAVAQHGSRHVSKAATFTLKENSLHFPLLLWKQWLWQYAKNPSSYAFVICRPMSGPLTINLQQPFTTIQVGHVSAKTLKHWHNMINISIKVA